MQFDKYIFPFIFLLFFSNCKNGNRSSINESGERLVTATQEFFPIDYVQWIQNPENGLRKEKTIEDITFLIQYKPTDYVICQEEKSNEIKKEVLQKKRTELEGMDYYDLKIMLNKGQGELLKYQILLEQEYQSRVNYFSFEMQQDISLITGLDTISCALFHFERAYDITPYSTFLLGFPKISTSNNKRENQQETILVLHDKIFKKGIVKFTFNNNDLIHIPKLKTI